MSGQNRVRAVAVGWTVASALPLLAIALSVLSRPDFPLGLGVIRTRGLGGLSVSLFPAAVAVAGVALLRRWPRVGAALVLAYAVFWSVLLAGMLPVVWNAQSSFCLRGVGVCITAAWLGRLVVLSLLLLFLFVGAWSCRALRRAPSGEAR